MEKHPGRNVLASLALVAASTGTVVLSQEVSVDQGSTDALALPLAYPERKTQVHDPTGELFQGLDDPLNTSPQNRQQRRAVQYGHVAPTFSHRLQ